MDFYRNVTFSGDYHQPEQVFPTPSSTSKLGGSVTPTSTLDDLFSAQDTEVDVSLEWLSVFVEDCLSSKGNCLPPPTTTTNNTTPPKLLQNEDKTQQNIPISTNCLEKFVIPSKARSKRKRVTSLKTRNPLSSWSNCNQFSLHFPSTDPPLLQQAYWLADSELIMPIKEKTTPTTTTIIKARESEDDEEEKVGCLKEIMGIMDSSNGQQQPRRCSHCLAQRTPQWRTGPLGPKTLCNACGVRYKSGRLLPEYRPAKSPTFVSYLHSNSHKKVLEMRMATTSSAPPSSVFTS